jgi:hypothetical protein
MAFRFGEKIGGVAQQQLTAAPTVWNAQAMATAFIAL